MPYVWIKCIACNGKGIVKFKSPTTGKWDEMACTACSGLGEVHVWRDPPKPKKK